LVVFTPILSLRHKAVVGADALISPKGSFGKRALHFPTRGLIHESRFTKHNVTNCTALRKRLEFNKTIFQNIKVEPGAKE